MIKNHHMVLWIKKKFLRPEVLLWVGVRPTSVLLRRMYSSCGFKTVKTDVKRNNPFWFFKYPVRVYDDSLRTRQNSEPYTITSPQHPPQRPASLQDPRPIPLSDPHAVTGFSAFACTIKHHRQPHSRRAGGGTSDRRYSRQVDCCIFNVRRGAVREPTARAKKSFPVPSPAHAM